MTITIISENIEINDNGVGLARIYRTPLNHVVRADVWRPKVSHAGPGHPGFSVPPASATGAVLNPRSYKWRPLIEIGPANWHAGARDVHHVPDPAAIRAAFRPVADDVYDRVAAMVMCLGSPVPASVPVVDVTVTTTDGMLVATYSSNERARTEIDAFNQEAGTTILRLAPPLPHDPPQTALRAAVDTARDESETEA